MMLRREDYTELQNNTQFCQAVKFVIKLQIATLLKQLADSGEESVVLTANIIDGTADHLGSDKGTGFLKNRDELQSQFLTFCSGTEGQNNNSSDTDHQDKVTGYLDSHRDILHLPLPGFRLEESDDYSSRLLSPSRLGTIYPSLQSRSGQRLNQERKPTETVFPRRQSSGDSRSIEDEHRVKGIIDVAHDEAVVETVKAESVWDENQSGILSVDLSDRQSQRSRTSPSSYMLGNEKSQISSTPSSGQYRRDIGSLKIEPAPQGMAEKPSLVTSTVGALYRAPHLQVSSSDNVNSGSFPTSKPLIPHSEPPTFNPATISPPYTASLAENQMSSTGDDDDPGRIQKKADTRIYNRFGYNPRKPMKSGAEHTARSPEFGMSKLGIGCNDYRQTDSDLLSPVNMSSLQPAHTPHVTSGRERSQSLSAVGTLMSETTVTRARFYSSSFDGSESPLFIDEGFKVKVETDVEGLDLSNKRPRLSSGDSHTSQGNGSQTLSSPDLPKDESDSSQNGVKDVYDRLVQMSKDSSPQTEQSQNSVKKYGKGNFIKVATGYQCRICCRVIRHMNNTTAHMRIHANVKPYKCQVCHQQFKYEVDRRYHFSKQHADLFSKIQFPPGSQDD